MNDNLIRESLKSCLSASSFPIEKQWEVLERIQGDQPIMKRKLSFAFVLAACLLLAMGALAVAASFGVFGTLSDNENAYVNGARLERLDEASDTLNISATVAAPTPEVMPTAAGTLYDELVARQGTRTFDLTINQAYCDGRNLYYSYTLTTNQNELSFGEGKPTGFDAWEWEEPGKTFKDVWHFDDQETYEKVSAWLDGGAQRYVALDIVGVGDGVSIADGSEKGVPTMIYDSAREWIDETTLQGFQEVELPEDYELGDSLSVLMSVMYSTTVYYQDETGVYRTGIRQAENRGILRVPFTVEVGGHTTERTGTFETENYIAHAKLTFTDVTAYGEVVFDAPEWAAAYQADTEYWMNGGTGEAPVMPEMIHSYQLIAGEEVMRNLNGGWGLNDEGQFHVYIEFDLPASMDSLVLRPEDKEFAKDLIPLK